MAYIAAIYFIGEGMPVTIAKMAVNEASITISGGALGEDSITLTYYPNKLTARNINQLDKGLDSLNQTLAEVIKSWDVLEEDGSMYPLEPARLADLGVPVLFMISKAIANDIRPN